MILHIPIYTTYLLHVYMSGHTISRQTLGALVNIGSTGVLTFINSLAQQDGSLLLRIYVYMHKGDVSSNCTHAVSLPSSWPLDPSLLSH